jgi:hypothetical protein
MNALDRLRVVAVNNNAEHHRLRPRLRDKVVSQVQHELRVVARAGRHWNKVRIANVGHALVADDPVPLLGDEVVNQLMHASPRSGRCGLKADHDYVRRQTIPQATEIDDGLLFINASADSQRSRDKLVPGKPNRLAQVGAPHVLGSNLNFGDCVHDDVPAPHHVWVVLLLR